MSRRITSIYQSIIKYLRDSSEWMKGWFEISNSSYIVDDCWSIKTGRSNTTHEILPDLTKFPDGINGTVAQIHALGLKAGLYSSAGTVTCAGYPASLGNEERMFFSSFSPWSIDQSTSWEEQENWLKSLVEKSMPRPLLLGAPIIWNMIIVAFRRIGLMSSLLVFLVWCFLLHLIVEILGLHFDRFNWWLRFSQWVYFLY